MTIETTWRGAFSNEEANRLHAEAFDTRVFDASGWNWENLVRAHSLGWVTFQAIRSWAFLVSLLIAAGIAGQVTHSG